jgi:cysteine synthase A
MESLNPSGTGKDRAVMYMLNAAKSHPHYSENVNIVEGTSGSTGIALAFQCNALGLKLHVVIPDDQSDEKKSLLLNLGAKVVVVPCSSISNKNHYVNTARRLAQSINGIFMDQFENEANFQAHFQTTGPEIWKQTNHNIDAFVMSSGTGGTIAGVSRCEVLNIILYFFNSYLHIAV